MPDTTQVIYVEDQNVLSHRKITYVLTMFLALGKSLVGLLFFFALNDNRNVGDALKLLFVVNCVINIGLELMSSGISLIGAYNIYTSRDKKRLWNMVQLMTIRLLLLVENANFSVFGIQTNDSNGEDITAAWYFIAFPALDIFLLANSLVDFSSVRTKIKKAAVVPEPDIEMDNNEDQSK